MKPEKDQQSREAVISIFLESAVTEKDKSEFEAKQAELIRRLELLRIRANIQT